MPGDDLTLGELGRRYDQLRADIREDFAGINTRLDQMPTQQLLTALLDRRAAQIDRHTDDIAELKEHRKTDSTARQADRDRDKRNMQFLIGAVLIPLALSILTLVLTLGGNP